MRAFTCITTLAPLALFAHFAAPPSAQAASYGSGSAGEEDHMLSVGGGIASPSVTSALGENPAGLSNNRSFKLLAQAASGNSEFNPIGYGGGVFMGNGTVGAGIALQGFNSNTDGAAGSILLLNWGLAADITGLNLSWGFTGTRTVTKSGEVHGTGSGTTWCIDTGLIFNPKGQSRFGVTLFQVLDDVDAIGAGWAYDVNQWATFAIDGSYTTGAQTTVAKPSLAIHMPGFQMTSGYGFRVTGQSWSWIRQGLSLGLGVPVGRTFTLQAYYNHLAHYYAGVTIAL